MYIFQNILGGYIGRMCKFGSLKLEDVFVKFSQKWNIELPRKLTIMELEWKDSFFDEWVRVGQGVDMEKRMNANFRKSKGERVIDE